MRGAAKAWSLESWFVLFMQRVKSVHGRSARTTDASRENHAWISVETPPVWERVVILIATYRECTQAPGC